MYTNSNLGISNSQVFLALDIPTVAACLALLALTVRAVARAVRVYRRAKARLLHPRLDPTALKWESLTMQDKLAFFSFWCALHYRISHR